MKFCREVERAAGRNRLDFGGDPYGTLSWILDSRFFTISRYGVN